MAHTNDNPDMKQNLLQRKKMAAGIRLFDVITKE